MHLSHKSYVWMIFQITSVYYSIREGRGNFITVTACGQVIVVHPGAVGSVYMRNPYNTSMMMHTIWDEILHTICTHMQGILWIYIPMCLVCHGWFLHQCGLTIAQAGLFDNESNWDVSTCFTNTNRQDKANNPNKNQTKTHTVTDLTTFL